MREYRGKRVDNGEWVKGCLFYKFCCGTEWHKYLAIQTEDGKEYEVLPKSVGQDTGRKNKNGVEIYNGDIIKFEDGGIQVIEWDEVTSGFCRRRKIDLSVPFALHKDCEEHIEIIGNTTDSPNLLESPK